VHSLLLSPSPQALNSEAVASGGSSEKSSGIGIDIPLLIYFGLWYLGNYYVSICVFFSHLLSDHVTLADIEPGNNNSFIPIIFKPIFLVKYLQYNITNKLALKAAGGASGFPLTISALQMGVGCLYGIFLWLAPDGRCMFHCT
jgi:solute carrier family 35 protein E1